MNQCDYVFLVCREPVYDMSCVMVISKSCNVECSSPSGMKETLVSDINGAGRVHRVYNIDIYKGAWRGKSVLCGFSLLEIVVVIEEDRPMSVGGMLCEERSLSPSAICGRWMSRDIWIFRRALRSDTKGKKYTSIPVEVHKKIHLGGNTPSTSGWDLNPDLCHWQTRLSESDILSSGPPMRALAPLKMLLNKNVFKLYIQILYLSGLPGALRAAHRRGLESVPPQLQASTLLRIWGSGVVVQWPLAECPTALEIESWIRLMHRFQMEEVQ
uniref:Uncharacterized protein n=1 Tax=Timema douglasi TaxID=61478 RepID=A0A7R8VCY8_TIMDO|nr:unnamed protein product [Timema douglasi]